MKPNKYKITPDVYKTLHELNKTLPQFQRRNDNGTLMFKNATRLVKGCDIPEAQTKEIKDFDSLKTYVQKGTEPVLVNHEVNLRGIWQKDGQKGIDAYVEFFTNEHKKQTVKNED